MTSSFLRVIEQVRAEVTSNAQTSASALAGHLGRLGSIADHAASETAPETAEAERELAAWVVDLVTAATDDRHGRDDGEIRSELAAIRHQLDRIEDAGGVILRAVLALAQDGVAVRLVLSAAALTYEQGSGQSTPTKFKGDTMSVQITDDQQVAYTVAAEDDKGQPVSDTLTWSESSGGLVVTVTPSADGTSAEFVAVDPGVSTITVTDGTLSASDTITVVAGAVSQLVLTPGTPEAQPAAPVPPAV